MIDFQNAGYVKLSEVPYEQVADQVSALLLDVERVLGVYKGMRDYVVFTDKRIIAVNVQGITGKKKGLHVATVLEDRGLLHRDRRHLRPRRRAGSVVLRAR